MCTCIVCGACTAPLPLPSPKLSRKPINAYQKTFTMVYIGRFLGSMLVWKRIRNALTILCCDQRVVFRFFVVEAAASLVCGLRHFAPKRGLSAPCFPCLCIRVAFRFSQVSRKGSSQPKEYITSLRTHAEYTASCLPGTKLLMGSKGPSGNVPCFSELLQENTEVKLGCC